MKKRKSEGRSVLFYPRTKGGRETSKGCAILPKRMGEREGVAWGQREYGRPLTPIRSNIILLRKIKYIYTV